jgi:hypothetical protein
LGSALGSKITVPGPDGRETFLLDRDGREVVSRMDAASLRAVATAGGGVFVDAGSTEQPLVAVYERGVIPELHAARAAGDGQGAQRANRYQIPLGVAVVVLLAELLVAQRRRHAVPGGSR